MYAFRLFLVHKNPSKTKHEVLTTQSSGLFSQKSLLQHKKIRNSDCLPNATFSQDKLGQEGSRGELGRVICSLPGCTLCFLPSSDLQAYLILYSVYRVLCVSPNVLKLERTELSLQTQKTPDSLSDTTKNNVNTYTWISMSQYTNMNMKDPKKNRRGGTMV